MQCPICKAANDPRTFAVETSAEEDGVKVSFTCGGCGADLYVVLQPEVFEEVC